MTSHADKDVLTFHADKDVLTFHADRMENTMLTNIDRERCGNQIILFPLSNITCSELAIEPWHANNMTRVGSPNKG